MTHAFVGCSRLMIFLGFVSRHAFFYHYTPRSLLPRLSSSSSSMTYFKDFAYFYTHPFLTASVVMFWQLLGLTTWRAARRPRRRHS